MESPQIQFDFMVKLAEPSFDLHDFSERRFVEHLDRYREQLVVDQIETAQWMWRGDLSNNEERIDEFRHQSASVAKAVALAKLSGRLGNFFCFPYSHSFASSALGNSFVDGLAIYRNPREGDYDDLLDKCEASGRSVLVIRPFYAGEALGSAEPRTLISHSAGVPIVTGIIVSCGSVEHLEECVRAAAQG